MHIGATTEKINQMLNEDLMNGFAGIKISHEMQSNLPMLSRLLSSHLY